jgi:ligand-binding sensor domain-containing protein
MTRAPHIVCLVIVLSAWTTAAVRAQENNVAFEPIQSKLSHTSVYAIHQDHLGYLWFGTEAGLHRYDGYELVTYTHEPSDSASLARSIVWSLEEDDRGRLWILNAAGVQIFDRRTRQFTPPVKGSHQLEGNPPHAGRLVKGPTGTIWWIRNGERPVLYDQQSHRLRPLEHIEKVRTFYEDSNGLLWFSTETPGLYRCDPATGNIQHFEPSPHQSWVAQIPIDAIQQDDSGFYWIVTRQGIGSFDGRSGRFKRRALFSPAPTRRPSMVVHNGDNVLWIRSFAELYRFNTETYELTRLIHSPDQDIWTVYPDRSGTVWVGALGALYRYSPQIPSFGHLTHEANNPNSLSSSLVTAIYKDENRPSTVWVGTIGGGLNRIDRTGERVVHYLGEDSLSGCARENIWAIQKDDNDVLWLGTDCGLYRFERSTGEFKAFLPYPDRKEDYLQNNIDVISKDPQGRLWMGTYQGDLLRFDKTAEDFIPVHNVDSPIRALHIDQNMRMWIGTQGQGLLRMDMDTRRFLRDPRADDEKSSLNASHVWFIHETDDSILWIGSTLGLSRLEPETGSYESFYTQDGLPGSVVYSILEDGSGRLWLGTNRGLSRFDPDGSSGQRFRNFDEIEGVGNVEFNRRAAFKSREGRFFFGGTNGVTYFYPERIRTNTHVPPIVFTDIRKSNRDTTVSINPFGRDNVVLSHRDYTVAFEFAALDYTNPEKNRYAYQLEGFDPDWRNAGSRRSARYTNLPPGEYVFRVKGSNNDGVWNQKGTGISLTVLPPFWRTWWFQIIVFVCIGGGLTVVHRYRIRRLKEMHRLRLRIAKDLHDHIGASLGSIALISDMMKRHLSLEDRGQHQLEKISRTAREILEDLREIVWLVNPDHDRMDHLVERMREVTSRLLPETRYTFDGPDHRRIDNLEMSFRRNVLYIYKELLHNIVRHADASKVAVQVDIDDRRFRLRVIDDGRGFTPEAPHRGHGLTNIQRRAEDLGATVSIESTPGCGTTVILTAKIT